MKTTVYTLSKLKGTRPIAAVTAYDALTARLADAAGVDLILVGDSVGNTLLGFESTVPVTLDMLLHHTAAVTRAQPQALVAADVPFAEAHFDYERVLASCQRLIQQGGASAVKIEASAALAPLISRLVGAGIPVWGHLGLQPQRIHTLGKYRLFGRSEAEAEELFNDALALEQAGCFALLIEMSDASLSQRITEAVKIPTIGIGAGPHVDGQILVCTDLLGMSPGYVPSFVRQFAQLGSAMQQGFADYVAAVRDHSFPNQAPTPTARVVGASVNDGTA